MLKRVISGSSSIIAVVHDFRLQDEIEKSIATGVKLSYSASVKSPAAAKYADELSLGSYIRDAAKCYCITSFLNALQSSARPEMAQFLANNWISADKITVWNRTLQMFKLPNAVCEVFRQVYSPIQLNDGTLVVVLPPDSDGNPSLPAHQMFWKPEYQLTASLFSGSLVPAVRTDSLEVLAMINTSRTKLVARLSDAASNDKLNHDAAHVYTELLRFAKDNYFDADTFKEWQAAGYQPDYLIRVGKVNRTISELCGSKDRVEFLHDLSEAVINKVPDAEFRKSAISKIKESMRNKNSGLDFSEDAFDEVFYPATCGEAASAGMIDGVISQCRQVYMLAEPAVSEVASGSFQAIYTAELIGGFGSELPYLITKQVDAYYPIDKQLDMTLYADWWRTQFSQASGVQSRSK